MQIVIDENIPEIHTLFPQHAVMAKPGRAINHDDVKHADVLIVRAVTQVNEKLLAGSAVRFVGTVTSGTDHLDINYLEQHHIHWYAATGCNSIAVAEYVLSVIAIAQQQQWLKTENLSVGIIGVGLIGQHVQNILKPLAVQFILHDPLRALNEKNFISSPLEAFADVDVVTLHTPLTFGDFATQHMLSKKFFDQLKPNCLLINTSRGEVIRSADLKTADQLHMCLDVWEHEPNIDKALLQQTKIATPHIAGYSVQSKLRGIQMVEEALSRLGFKTKANINLLTEKKQLSIASAKDWREVISLIFNPWALDHALKTAHHPAEVFDLLRKNFTSRFEFEFIQLIETGHLSSQDVEVLLTSGFKILP